MSRTQELLTLCTEAETAFGLTHWALSYRIFKRGDFFDRLRKVTPKQKRPVSTSADNADKAVKWFSENWPDGASWPAGIPRPPVTDEDRAA